ncbi:hypothetical protein FEM08_28110 [Flavobacterium gilvum]|nr:hypothetical protein FEM08_28110 [Flavobacterium gilvum]
MVQLVKHKIIKTPETESFFCFNLFENDSKSTVLIYFGSQIDNKKKNILVYCIIITSCI